MALAVKKKIWRDEYIDMFSLLHVEPEPTPKVGDPIKDQETIQRHKIDKNWMNWLYGYVIYVAVVVQMQPKKTAGLIKYQNIVHSAM